MLPKEQTNKILLDFLKRIKQEIEKDGLVATIDEAIIRVEEQTKDENNR